jgi:hypothetical protein
LTLLIRVRLPIAGSVSIQSLTENSKSKKKAIMNTEYLNEESHTQDSVALLAKKHKHM